MPPAATHQRIAEGPGWQMWRGADATGAPVSIKAHDEAVSESASLARCHREFEILHSLEGPSTPRVLTLDLRDPRPSLVLQDLADYRTLADVGRDPGGWTLERVLALAPKLAAAVGEIHQAGVVHRAIRPEHVLLGARGEVLLIAFEEATRMQAEEAPYDAPPRDLALLRYASPEQTGRMNRLVDYRSDLYSLGLVLYELLTGGLPFPTDDVVGAIHSHIAIAPVPPRARRPEVPQAVEAIVLKLLAKTPDLRYQNAFALAEDLRLAADAWRAGRELPLEDLGRDDRGGHFVLSQHLYGRGADAEQLTALFQRAAEGPRQLVLVSGPSGVGKTALVHETHRPLAERRGYFAAGKFEQHERVTPFSGVRRALADLVEQIADDRPAVREAIALELAAELGSSAALLLEVLPELGALLGPAASSPELGGGDVGVRFRLAVRKLVERLARPAHPVVLFLDDLQWIDAASLRLLEDLACADELAHLLIVGAYRAEEVGAGHPLQAALRRLEAQGAPLTKIELAPLSVQHVQRLVEDSFPSDLAFAERLAQQLHAETEGNPFFVRRSLVSLRDDRVLQFDFRHHRWACDLEALARRAAAPDVVDLMVRQLRRLSPETVATLELAACIGNGFDLATLAGLCGVAPHLVQARLWPAAQSRMIVPVAGREWAELGAGAAALIDEHAPRISYRFRHDRVQQAAASLVQPERLPALHLALCRWLRAGDVLQERLFETASHCVRALEAIELPGERVDAARLILRAAARANATNAAAAAKEYCLAAQAALRGAPQVDALRFEAARTLGESEVLLGEYDQARGTFQDALARAPQKLDRVAVLTLLMEMWVSRGELDQALQTLIDALRLFELTIDPTNVAQVARDASAAVHRARHGRSVEEIVGAPDTADPEVAALLDLLGRAIDTAYMSGRDWVVAVTATGVVTALTHGGTLASSMSFSTYGLVDAEPATPEGFARRAEYGRIGALIAERHGVAAWISRANVSNPQHFARTFRQATEIFERAADAGWSSSAPTWGAYAEVRALFMMLAAGVPLASIEAERANRVVRIRRANRAVSEVCCDALGDFVVALTEPTEAPWLLGGSAARAAAVRERALRSGPWAACHLLALEQLLAVIHQRWDVAAEAGRALAQVAHASLGMAHEHLALVFDAFTAVATVPAGDAAAQAAAEVRVARAEQFLAPRVPLNADFGPSLHAVRGARAQLAGDRHRALEEFNRCVEAARASEQTHLSALACERAFAVAESLGWRALARGYLTEAHAAWSAWGAPVRARELVERFPMMLGEEAGATSTFSAADVESLLKSVRAISGELRLSELLPRLMHIVLENAGAQRGLFVLERQGVPVVEAQSVVQGSQVVTTLPAAALAPDDPAYGLVQRTLRTGDALTLDDVERETRFGLGRLPAARRPRSTLTMPIESQGRRIGVLHLENREVTHAFRPGARRALWLLVSHAVTALENARLYGDLQVEIEVRRRTEAALRVERDDTATMFENLPLLACAITADGRMVLVNPAVERALGVGREALVGRSWWETLHADPRERAALQARVEREGGAQAQETALVDGAGARHLVSWTCVRTAETAERPGHLLCFGEDVTEERRREEAQAKLEEHLRRAQQLETVGTLAAGIAHDFNNVLVPITTYADFLVAQLAAGSDAHDCAREIQTASVRAAALVRRILTASRKAAPVRRPVLLQEVAGEVCRLLEASLGSTVSVRLEVDPRCPAIVGDASQLHQALLNLGTNAGHAMRPHGGSLTVRVALDAFPAGALLEGQPCVQVTFADTGHGMDEATRARIFDPFFTTKPVGEGTGLGLWVVHGVVQASGGELRVESQPGAGTTFRLYFPLGGEADAVPVEVGPRALEGRERVLVVDDEAAVARALTRLLESLGYRVTSFTSPTQALEAYRAHPSSFDVVVSDFTMPGLDGLQLAQQLTALRPLPIVLTSGLVVDREPGELAALGVRAVLQKPVAMSELAAAIRRALGG